MGQIITKLRAVPSSKQLKGLATAATGRQLSNAQLEHALRFRRSNDYVDQFAKLDAGCHVSDPKTVDSLIAAIHDELPLITIENAPVAILARCGLGNGHDVHTLDRTGRIITHFKTYESLPPLLERARSIALHPDYTLVEIYTDCLFAVRTNGDVSLIRL
jgi:hypothetical protein